MPKRPGSNNKISWSVYKFRRKIHFLLIRGTLFHKVPKQVRSETRVHPPGVSFRQRLRLLFRLIHYRFVHQSERKPIRKPELEIKRANVYRKLRYLNHTGNLYRSFFLTFKGYWNRNYAYLGKGKYLIIMVNSTFFFLLAYLFVFLIREATMVIAAGTFNINTVMMYYDVEYLIRGKEWTGEAVKVVFTSGPLITFMIAMISLVFLALSGHEKWDFRIFIMWVFLQAFTQSLGEVVCGSFLNQGFGWVLAFMFVDDTAKMIMVIVIFLIMLTAGLFLSRVLLLTGNVYFNNLGASNRRSFLMTQVLLPFLLGTGIMICIKQPVMNFFDLIVQGSMLVILFPAFFTAQFSNDLFFDEDPRQINIKWGWILGTSALFLLFRIYFWKGIRF